MNVLARWRVESRSSRTRMSLSLARTHRNIRARGGFGRIRSDDRPRRNVQSPYRMRRTRLVRVVRRLATKRTTANDARCVFVRLRIDARTPRFGTVKNRFPTKHRPFRRKTDRALLPSYTLPAQKRTRKFVSFDGSFVHERGDGSRFHGRVPHVETFQCPKEDHAHDRHTHGVSRDRGRFFFGIVQTRRAFHGWGYTQSRGKNSNKRTDVFSVRNGRDLSN